MCGGGDVDKMAPLVEAPFVLWWCGDEVSGDKWRPTERRHLYTRWQSVQMAPLVEAPFVYEKEAGDKEVVMKELKLEMGTMEEKVKFQDGDTGLEHKITFCLHRGRHPLDSSRRDERMTKPVASDEDVVKASYVEDVMA
ncbi:hypothetical protein Sjap_006014 [Stephania japonica]|uniref:Uncharacterized protein n=1 Tax=Stephania japonica TaxID=461633 RepID=A0AAP0PME8_9MAGN